MDGEEKAERCRDLTSHRWARMTLHASFYLNERYDDRVLKQVAQMRASELSNLINSDILIAWMLTVSNDILFICLACLLVLATIDFSSSRIKDENCIWICIAFSAEDRLSVWEFFITGGWFALRVYSFVVVSQGSMNEGMNTYHPSHALFISLRETTHMCGVRPQESEGQINRIIFYKL